MAGHSRWAQIKRQKGVTDARRGQLFSKLSRHIMSAVRQGGADPDTNLKLQYAIEKAREASMPKENIERAIQRASSGSSEGATLEEVVYEVYGVGGAAVVIEALTDNKNRTAADVRLIVEKHGGSLAGTNAVAWNFDKKGVAWVPRGGVSEDAVVEAAIAAGAEDVQVQEDGFQVVCAPRNLAAVRRGLAERRLPVERGEIALLPKALVTLSAAEAAQMTAMLEALEAHDDVQNLFTNYTTAADAVSGSTGGVT